MNVISERVREAMSRRGWEQKHLAAAVGCTQGTISQILLGHTQRTRYLPDIAGALGVSMDWLRGATEDEQGTTDMPDPWQFVSAKFALPSVAMLREMFASLLVLVPEGATREETAQILAERLGTGIAACGPFLVDPSLTSASARRSPASSSGTRRGTARPETRN
jgi:transcriptional regulator with XRE-family HTH domain